MSRTRARPHGVDAERPRGVRPASGERREDPRRLPRSLHPVAWWVWALGLAAAASTVTNPWLLAMVVLVASVVVLARRTDAPWALSFRMYLLLGLLVVVLRVVFRIALGGGPGGTVLVDLPEIPLPDVVRGIRLLGPVTAESVLAGLHDGMRLAAIIICVGAANTLANPKRLLASLPPALYEVGAAVVVAMSLFPQLAESVQRVRRARRLRGDAGRGVGALRRVVVPVLEDALERSMTLAAGMDARGYGRLGGATARERTSSGACMLIGLVGMAVGVYAVLDSSAPRWLALPMLVLGSCLAVVGLSLAGRRVGRVRYRPDRWRPAELGVAASGVAVAVATSVVARTEPLVAHPAPGTVPLLTLPAVAAVLVAVVPAFLAPAPVPTVVDPDPRGGGRG